MDSFVLALKVGGKIGDRPPVDVLSDGSLLLASYPTRRRFGLEENSDSPPVEFLAIDSPSAAPLARSWDQVLRTSRESEIVSALRILEPDLRAILFLPGTRPLPSSASGV